MTKKLTREEWDRIKPIDFDSMDATKVKESLSLLLNLYPARQEELHLVRALTNPLTREWALDKFVEEEKKYYWKLKDNEEFSLAYVGVTINIILRNKSKLTESEIKAWGYNPEMFDKEEV